MSENSNKNLLEFPTEDDIHIFKLYKSRYTLNKYGKMSLTPNPLFKSCLSMICKSKPVLDIGCAFGYTSKLLLDHGYKVIANDLDQLHLDNLVKSLDAQSEEKSRLQIKIGNINDLNFEDGSLSAILGFNVMHFMSGEEIRNLFMKFFKWLSPNGILILSSASPYILKDYNYLKKYYNNYHNKVEWPGECKTGELLNSDEISIGQYWINRLPDNFHFFSSEILCREALLSGFSIFKLEYFDENENGYVEINHHHQRSDVGIVCIKDSF
jgi:SAM-dependent methyltransferase